VGIPRVRSSARMDVRALDDWADRTALWVSMHPRPRYNAGTLADFERDGFVVGRTETRNQGRVPSPRTISARRQVARPVRLPSRELPGRQSAGISRFMRLLQSSTGLRALPSQRRWSPPAVAGHARARTICTDARILRVVFRETVDPSSPGRCPPHAIGSAKVLANVAGEPNHPVIHGLHSTSFASSACSCLWRWRMNSA
jgi:hypothetical protein